MSPARPLVDGYHLRMGDRIKGYVARTRPEEVNRTATSGDPAVDPNRQTSSYVSREETRVLNASVKPREEIAKCSLGHIDDGVAHGKLLTTEGFGCTAEMQSFLKISVQSYASEDGDNHSTHTLVKVVFIAANLLNQSITFYREVEAV